MTAEWTRPHVFSLDKDVSDALLLLWVLLLPLLKELPLRPGSPKMCGRSRFQRPGYPAVGLIIWLSRFFQPFVDMSDVWIPRCLYTNVQNRLLHPAFSASDFSRSLCCSRVKPRPKKLFHQQTLRPQRSGLKSIPGWMPPPVRRLAATSHAHQESQRQGLWGQLGGRWLVAHQSDLVGVLHLQREDSKPVYSRFKRLVNPELHLSTTGVGCPGILMEPVPIVEAVPR